MNVTYQVLDLKKVELVYSSSFFKSIETGGNVSKALVCSNIISSMYASYWHITTLIAKGFVTSFFYYQMVASGHACYNTVLSYQNRLLLLGLKVKT